MPPSKEPVKPQPPDKPGGSGTDPDDPQLEEPKDAAFEENDTSNVSE
jgi:hypothetical protein